MIDAEKLREAIAANRLLMENCRYTPANRAAVEMILDAAEAHLATLPREVEVEDWAILWLDSDLIGDTLYRSEEKAAKMAGTTGVAVRLTGTATISGRKP